MKSLKLLMFFIIFLISNVNAATQQVSPEMIPDEIIKAIEKNECAYDANGRCNPYTIGLNTSSDIRLAKNLGYTISSGRIIECGNIVRCTEILQRLHSYGLKNTDNGPYQINHLHNPMNNLSDYFTFEKSESKVKSILAGLINRDGYSWQTIAKYHSATPELNERYRKKLFKNIYNYSPLSDLK